MVRGPGDFSMNTLAKKAFHVVDNNCCVVDGIYLYSRQGHGVLSGHTLDTVSKGVGHPREK